MRREARIDPAARPRATQIATGSSPCASKRGIHCTNRGRLTAFTVTPARAATSMRNVVRSWAIVSTAQTCASATAGLAPHNRRKPNSRFTCFTANS